MKKLAALGLCLLLGGCWESSTQLLSGMPSVTPLRAGKVQSRNDKDETGHAVLTLEGGQYRLTNDDKADSDFGESFTLRVFALPGAPSDVFAYEARESCKPADADCKPADKPYYYGLLRVMEWGAYVANPDCPDTGLAGAKSGGYGNCTFTSRASLEKALNALGGTLWKADILYTYD